MPRLADWQSFYVILGSSAAVMTGLQFVVMTIGTKARTVGGEGSVHAFGTPTIVHFCLVMMVSGVLCVPGQSFASLSFCLAATAIGGLIYTASALRLARRQSGYQPVLADWIWHFALPAVAYAVMAAGAIDIAWRTIAPLYVIAASSGLLLFTGIHNAWDAAVYLSLRQDEG